VAPRTAVVAMRAVPGQSSEARVDDLVCLRVSKLRFVEGDCCQDLLGSEELLVSLLFWAPFLVREGRLAFGNISLNGSYWTIDVGWRWCRFDSIGAVIAGLVDSLE
jgi:hypothetical protein